MLDSNEENLLRYFIKGPEVKKIQYLHVTKYEFCSKNFFTSFVYKELFHFVTFVILWRSTKVLSYPPSEVSGEQTSENVLGSCSQTARL